MTQNLEQILICASNPDFEKQIADLHQIMTESASFAIETGQYKAVTQIITIVEKNRDKALIEYTAKYDNVTLTADQLRITKEELKQAHNQIEPQLLNSLRGAIGNVRKYQSEIFFGSKNTHTGIKYTPIERIGICVPGASAPLPSTVIMTAVPAQIAGVKEIVVVSPPRHNGSIHPVILGLCHELGITEVYRIGGAQAVAALAIGTETIPKVDKIVGPGNQWVQTAKKLVLGRVGIDSIAGPSEVLIIADENAKPDWIAADMLSQAEHAPGSAILATDSTDLAQKVLDELTEQVQRLDRTEDTQKCLTQFSKIVVFENLDGAIDFANDFASEHLQIQCGPQSKKIAEKIKNAGAIFIGEYSPVALGDYWAGPSHTLPTGTTAKFFSAVTSNDFLKSISIIEYDKKKLSESAEHIIRLASTEGLDAHAKSVKIRQNP